MSIVLPCRGIIHNIDYVDEFVELAETCVNRNRMLVDNHINSAWLSLKILQYLFTYGHSSAFKNTMLTLSEIEFLVYETENPEFASSNKLFDYIIDNNINDVKILLTCDACLSAMCYNSVFDDSTKLNIGPILQIINAISKDRNVYLANANQMSNFLHKNFADTPFNKYWINKIINDEVYNKIVSIYQKT